MAELVKGHAPVQLIVCGDSDEAPHPFLLRPVPLQIPPLGVRTSALPRIVEEYALDAIHELGAGETVFTRADRDWVLARSASTLPEIEKGPPSDRGAPAGRLDPARGDAARDLARGAASVALAARVRTARGRRR